MSAVAGPRPEVAGASPASSRRWLIAITAALAALLEIVDTSIVNVALTDMQSALGATLSEVGWVITSYAIANVIVLPLAAWLGETFGKKRYFVFSLIGFTASSIMCGLSTSLSMLVLARVLQGLTGGGLLAKAQSILFETFPKEEQGKAQALFGVVAIAGPAIGPVLGGYIVTNLDWRWIFFINLPIGVVAVFMALTFLPTDEPKPETDREREVDWLGLALLVVGLGSLQTLLEEGQSNGWFDSPEMALLAVTATLGLVAFVVRQLRVAHPVVDLRVLRHRSLAGGAAFSLVLGMSLYGALFAVPIFAQSVLHFTAQETGLLLLPGALASAFMMPFAGRFSQIVDPRVLIAGGALGLVGAILLLGRLSVHTSTDDLQLPLILRGGATVFMFLPLSLAAIGPLPKKDMPAATGIYNLTRQLGGSIGIAMLTTILARRQVFHAAVLADKVSLGNPLAVARLEQSVAGLAARGVAPEHAKQVALASLHGSVKLQAAIMSFNDCFTIVAGMILLSLPLILLLGRPQRGAAPDAGH
ncbi:MAG TPA: DHA2 family efflux MFS transporter permease subunit [Polyangiaceae bacterium]|nr:DHA2 family efflux MFS transporter permease subunit [Polyangiaceae bacterium]